MTPDELKKAMDRANLTVGELAQMTGRHERTVYRWLAGDIPVPKWISLVLKK